MKTLTKWLRALDVHGAVGIFSLICTIVGVMAALQHSDQKSNELWAKDGRTAVAAKE